MLHVTVLLSERQLVDEFLRTLAARTLPEKFFYWFPSSVRAWLNLCGDVAYRNFVRSQTLLHTYTADLITHLPDGPIEVVSLGAGQGVKDLVVLEQLRTSGRTPLYVPVDASQALLEMACEAAQQRGFSCRGVKADLMNPAHLAVCHDPTQAWPRLVMLLGNTLGAFDPLAYPAQVAAWLRPQDYLLIDGELFSPIGTMPGYDNPINRQFAFAPLRSVGLAEPRDGLLQFEMSHDARKPGLYRLSKHFQAGRDLTILIAGETLELEAGTRIEMNWSYKYAREAFVALLHEAGIERVTEYLSDDERFLMVLGCRR